MWSSSAACRLGKKVLHSLLAFAFQSSRFLAHLEQVLSDFVATKRALLILDSADLRVLQRLRIELDQLYAACSDGAQTRQAPHPGKHVADSGFERRREPALAFVSPIVEAGLSVAGL